MSRLDRYEQDFRLARSVSRDAWKLARRQRRKRRRRVWGRLVRAAMLMALATFVIIPAMIAKGWLLGPLGAEGLLATPLILLVTWGGILWWALAPRSVPRVIAKADIAQLPAQTDEWLDSQRRLLPTAAQSSLDSIALRLEALTPQLQTLDAQQPQAAEIRRLLGEELPELVRGYQKVPRALQQQPLNGGLSPESQLVQGLATIDEQIGRVHEQLAANDLHALATHQRYLDLKYKRDDKLE